MAAENPILNTDAYSVSSNGFAPESAKRYSCYNFTNRKLSQVAFPGVAIDSRMILYGIRHYIETYLTKKITVANVREAELFLNNFHSFGGPIYFPKDLWMRVATECGGYLPITIKSLPDGSTFYPYEPVIQVEAKDGFGELAAHVEARLVGAIANATACATLCRHWRERIEEQVDKDLKLLGRGFGYDTLLYYAKWIIHNFGSRACVSGEESRLLGMAHLLSFNGSDNLDAAYQARCEGAIPPTGSSILATAHRNIQSWDGELQAFSHIAEIESITRKDKFKIVACVSDCYDFTCGLKRVADLAEKDKDTVYVCRPDSGDGKAQLLQICNEAKSRGLFTLENGYYKATNLRFIYGDSVTPQYMFECMEALREQGFLPSQWGVFGVGGYLINNSTRDSLSSAFKLAETYTGPKVKFSNTPAKMSVPYNTKIKTDVDSGEPRVYINGTDSRITVYDNGNINIPWNFNDCIDLVDNHFIKQPQEDWGINGESLCQEIKDFRQQELIKRNLY